MSNIAVPRPIAQILALPALDYVAHLALAAPVLISGVVKLLDFSGAMNEVAGLGLGPAGPVAAAVIVTQLGGSLLFLTRRYCWLGPASWRASQCWRPSWPIRSGPSRDRTGGARPPPSSSMWPSSAVWPWRRCSSMAGAQPDDLPPEHRG